MHNICETNQNNIQHDNGLKFSIPVNHELERNASKGEDDRCFIHWYSC